MELVEAQPPMSARELAAAYERGVTTPTEVADRCLARARASHAVFTRVTDALALKQAERSTKRWRAGAPLGPMDGVPLTWKDLFDIQGTPTTAASALLANAAPATADATLVAHAEAAGMVCIGKTNLSEFAYSGLGLNPTFGTPINPALGARARAPGGSSSGAALAVALGVAPIGIGTDTAGSVRVPAAFNGLVGFRASRHRYAMAGVFPLAPSLDTVGPLARTVGECIAMDAVLQGGRGHEGHEALARTLDQARAVVAAQIFVVDPRMLEGRGMNAAVRYNLLARLRQLGDAGATIDYRELPSLHETHALIDSHGWLGACEAFATHEARLDSPDAGAMDARVRSRLEAARHFTAALYLHLRWARRRLMAQFAQELGGATLVLPTTAHTAPLLETLADDAVFASTNLATLRLTMPGSFLDAPTVAMPSGLEHVHAPDGAIERLPTGMQFMRPRGEDLQLLQTAFSVERLLSSTSLKE